MSLQAPLSINFIQDYFTATWSASGNISFRTINSALSRTTPDAFSDFLNNQVDRFSFQYSIPSGTTYSISSATGDLDTSFNNYKTFYTNTVGGSAAGSVWQLINTYQYGTLTSYTVRIYLDHISGALPSGTIRIYHSNSSTGPWTLKTVGAEYSTTSYSFTPNTSGNDYFQMFIESPVTGTTYQCLLGIGIEIS
jgi:hypothetical protein